MYNFKAINKLLKRKALKTILRKKKIFSNAKD